MLHDIRALIIPIVIIGIIVYRRMARQKLRQKHNLAKRQRAVTIERQWLNPVIELVIIGGVLWADLQHGVLPWLALLVGVCIGLPLGAYRGKFMYVRSLENTHKVVVERNLAEIGIFLGLIVIKIIADAISHDPNSLINLAAVALLGVGLSSSIGRVAYITYRHMNASRHNTNSNHKKA